MAERDGSRRHPDALGIVMGILFLAVASVGLTGNTWWLLSGNWRWMVAGFVAAVGLIMVAGSLPGRRRGQDDR